MQELPSLDQHVQEISASELKRRLDDGETFTMLDTRRPEEFEAWQLTHPNLATVNVPFTEFLDESGEQPASSVPAGVPDEPLVTNCAKGLSSTYVAKFLQREGWTALPLAEGMEGWAQVYDRYDLSTDRGRTTAVQVHRPATGCLSYLFVDGDEAAVVDPLRAAVDEYREIVREHDAKLEYAIDTHVHADHVSGVRTIAEATGAEVVLPAEATDRGLTFEARLVRDGESLPFGDGEMTAHGLPGHTTEMTGFRFDGVLAVGDTIFLDSVARPDLEDEDEAREAAGRLWETLQDLATMDEELLVGPGHVEPTTPLGESNAFTASLGELRERLRGFDEPREAFVEWITSNLGAQPNNYEQIIDINLGRETADADESFELELGPNNCAVSG